MYVYTHILFKLINDITFTPVYDAPYLIMHHTPM